LRRSVASMNAAMLAEESYTNVHSARATGAVWEVYKCWKLWVIAASGDAGLANHDCGPLHHPLGTALANQQHTYALQQISRGIHALGEEHVGLGIVIVDAHFAGYQDGWRLRRMIFYFCDELRAVHSRHGHVGDHQ